MAFDINAALAGANSAANLIDTMVYKPERDKLAMESQQLQNQAARFNLEQAQQTAGREQEIRTLQGQQGDLFAKLKNKQTQLDSIMTNPNAPIKDRLTAVLNRADSGHIAALKNGNLGTLVSDADNATKTYTGMLQNPASVTPESKKGMLDSFARYYGNMQSQYDPNSFTAEFDDSTHQITVKSGNKVVDTIEDPNKAMMMMRNDVNELRGMHDSLTAALAAKGDKTAQETVAKFYTTLDEKDKILTQKDTLMKIATPSGKQLLSVVPYSDPETSRSIFKAVIDDSNKVLQTKANAPLTAYIEQQKVDFNKKLANKTFKQKFADVADQESAFINMINQDPKAQELAANSTMTTEDAARTIFNVKDVAARYEKGAELDIKEKEANAKLLSAEATRKALAAKSTEKTGTDNLVAVLTSKQKRYNELIKLGVLADESQRKEAQQLAYDMKNLERQITEASYTPSGKKSAIPSVGESQNKFGNLSQEQFNTILNNL